MLTLECINNAWREVRGLHGIGTGIYNILKLVNST